ncbi:hypothetical protein [Streptomyces sp. NPDC001930]|uniref:hypothetical protein n=1 Tax=Streptomyces sp. NPDC001930 TaxID=3364625 RepID=UPI0036CAE271
MGRQRLRPARQQLEGRPLVPVPVPGLTSIKDIKDVVAGGAHALALTEDGRVNSWVESAYGQLGNGSTTARYEDILGKGFTLIVAGLGGEAAYAF